LLERIRSELEPYSTVEQFPRLEGRQMVMMLAPKKAAGKHHPNKPEAGTKASPKSAKTPESTAVGSK